MNVNYHPLFNSVWSNWQGVSAYSGASFLVDTFEEFVLWIQRRL